MKPATRRIQPPCRSCRQPHLLAALSQGVESGDLLLILPGVEGFPLYPCRPAPRLLTQDADDVGMISRDAVNGVVVTGLEVVLDMLLQHGIVEVDALHVVLPRQLRTRNFYAVLM